MLDSYYHVFPPQINNRSLIAASSERTKKIPPQGNKEKEKNKVKIIYGV